jgi:uncharacterized protein YneF (UPF0154 family)
MRREMQNYSFFKSILIMLFIFSLIFIGFWIAVKIEEKLGRHVDAITGWA